MRVAVAGLGLIGGSVALALSAAGHDVIGHDADPATRRAAGRGFTVAEDPAELRRSDIAVIAVPVSASAEAAGAALGADYDGLVTDVASVKAVPARELASYRRYVGGHPMAGKASAGFAAADPGLFTDRPWVLCLDDSTDLGDWGRLARLWTSIGARVVPTTAAAHDRAAARISHVDHVAAAALTLVADEPLARSLAAGSFRDGTRVAASPVQLVEGMAEGNRDELLTALDELSGELARARAAVADTAPDAMRSWFDRARRLRSSWPPEPGPPETMALDRQGLLALGAEGGWVDSVKGIEVATVRRPRVKSTS